MEVPGLGSLTLDEALGWYFSDTVTASVLGGVEGRVVVLADCVTDQDASDVHRAIATFLSTGNALPAASRDVFAYYRDVVRIARDSGWGDEIPEIAGPDAVWDHVNIGTEFHVDRNDDGHVYVSIECSCAWEPEHGLQIVLREGSTVTKVGPYDGHLTHTGSRGRGDLDDVVYVSLLAP